MQNTHLLTTILLFFFSANLMAQSFEVLDDSYGDSGNVVIDMDGHRDAFKTMLLQTDGKLLLAGSNYYGYDQVIGQQSDFALVRLNTDGSLDETFGEEGKVILTFGHTREEITSIGLTSSGKIVVVGYAIVELGEEERARRVVLMRYHSDGLLDETFGDKGMIMLDVALVSANTGLIQLPNSDKFLLTNYRGWKDYGSTEVVRLFELIGFNENGTIDHTFGDNGRLTYSKEELDVEYFDGVSLYRERIYFAGTKKLNGIDNFALASFHLTGELDTLFGDKGVASVNFGYSGGAYAQEMVFQADHSIIVMGMANKGPKGDFALTRFSENGQLDTIFGTGGLVTTEFTNYSALSIQNDDYPMQLFLEDDDKILLIGHSGPLTGINYWDRRTIAVSKYNNDGLLDDSFGNKGKLLLSDYNADTYIPSIFIKQKDRKIIFAGSVHNDGSDFKLVRFMSDLNVGTVDLSSQINNALVYPNPIHTEATLEYTLETPETLTIQLTDLTGRILKTYLQNEPQKAGEYQQAIDLPTGLSHGMYLLRLSSEKGQLVIKVEK